MSILLFSEFSCHLLGEDLGAHGIQPIGWSNKFPGKKNLFLFLSVSTFMGD